MRRERGRVQRGEREGEAGEEEERGPAFLLHHSALAGVKKE